MNPFEFKIGDTVCLNSGGQVMTVESVEDKSKTSDGCIVGSPIHIYTVIWLRDDGRYQEAQFDGRMLQGDDRLSR